VLKEQNAGLLRRVQELEALKKEQKPSKSRIMAEETLKLLQAGPVTMEQLAKINAKYPSDCVYYVKTILKINVERVKTDAGNVYMLAADALRYKAEQAQKKLVAESQAKDAKEEVPPAPTQTSSTQYAHA
jgi:hypothetical protein